MSNHRGAESGAPLAVRSRPKVKARRTVKAAALVDGRSRSDVDHHDRQEKTGDADDEGDEQG
jgi:hypothetical protein